VDKLQTDLQILTLDVNSKFTQIDQKCNSLKDLNSTSFKIFEKLNELETSFGKHASYWSPRRPSPPSSGASSQPSTTITTVGTSLPPPPTFSYDDVDNDDIVEGIFNETYVKVIVVTGETKVEAINSDGILLCALPDLPESRSFHSMDENVICGGFKAGSSIRESGPLSNCLHFEEGQWMAYNLSLPQTVHSHVSWRRPDGGIQLMGGMFGGGYNSKSFLVTNNISERIFDVKYDIDDACAIKLDDYVIITGDGNRRFSKVSKYDMNGWVENLPNLIYGRVNHGCGHYYTDANELVYLVSGGTGEEGSKIAFTEILAESAKSWSLVGRLPYARKGLSGISINNQIFMTGGYGYDKLKDILKYNPDTKEWVKTGEMENAMAYHASSVLPITEVKPYCNL